MKKKIIILILALILTVQPVASLAAQNPEPKPGEAVIEPISDEEKERLAELERQAEWERQVAKVEHKSIDELTTTYLLGDFVTGEILIEDNIDELVAIASTTKILTVFVALDEISKGNISYSDVVKIDKQTAAIGGSTYGLKVDEEYTVKQLITAAMVLSGNDAVNALAKYIAGTESNYVNMMKAKLDSLGIKKYELINTSGLPNYNINKQNMMTTRGLFTLSREFLKTYPEILETCQITEINEMERNFKGKNTNPLLGIIPEIDGLKTGYTGLAGRCMVATGIVRGDKVDTDDMRLIGITMGSVSDAARYVAIKKLMENAFADYRYRILGNLDKPLKRVESEKFFPGEVDVYTKFTISFISKTTDNISMTEEIQDIVPPKDAGAKVGEAVYYVNGEEKLRTDLIIKEPISELSLMRRVQMMYEELFNTAYMVFNN